jgi:polysaccharide pyruvyl transferase WcaK-like protein
MQKDFSKIALLHHTGGGNLGDQASVDAVITNIKRRWPGSLIALLSMNPSETAKIHGIPSYPLRTYGWEVGYQRSTTDGKKASERGLLQWLRATRTPLVRLPRAVWRELAFLRATYRVVRRFDLLIVSGGGQLSAKSGAWGFPYSLLTWCLLARAARVRCLLLNVGAGPLAQSLSGFFVNRTLHAADYVSFRDEPSQILARKVGFTGKSKVFPDNVYSLTVPEHSFGELRKRDRPVVGIAPLAYPTKRAYCTLEQETAYDNVIATFAAFASALAGRSYSLALFGTDIGEDPAVIEDLRRVLRDRHHIATPTYEPSRGVDELLCRMALMDYVVTCRFHGVVFAHILNKPVLAISPHPKVADHMSALGLSKYCVDIRTFDAHLLADRFEVLVRERDSVKTRLAAGLATRRSMLKRQFDELFPPKHEAGMKRGKGAGHL